MKSSARVISSMAKRWTARELFREINRPKLWKKKDHTRLKNCLWAASPRTQLKMNSKITSSHSATSKILSLWSIKKPENPVALVLSPLTLRTLSTELSTSTTTTRLEGSGSSASVPSPRRSTPVPLKSPQSPRQPLKSPLQPILTILINPPSRINKSRPIIQRKRLYPLLRSLKKFNNLPKIATRLLVIPQELVQNSRMAHLLPRYQQVNNSTEFQIIIWTSTTPSPLQNLSYRIAMQAIIIYRNSIIYTLLQVLQTPPSKAPITATLTPCPLNNPISLTSPALSTSPKTLKTSPLTKNQLIKIQMMSLATNLSAVSCLRTKGCWTLFKIMEAKCLIIWRWERHRDLRRQRPAWMWCGQMKFSGNKHCVKIGVKTCLE